jgi:hypothetical protein
MVKDGLRTLLGILFYNDECRSCAVVSSVGLI